MRTLDRGKIWPLAVGAIVPRKGFDVLARALGGLKFLDWRLRLVGALDRSPEAVAALRAEIAANGPLAVAATKHIIDEGADWPADEIWTRQKQILERVIASQDAREGALAFAQKRPPRWTGR